MLMNAFFKKLSLHIEARSWNMYIYINIYNCFCSSKSGDFSAQISDFNKRDLASKVADMKRVRTVDRINWWFRNPVNSPVEAWIPQWLISTVTNFKHPRKLHTQRHLPWDANPLNNAPKSAWTAWCKLDKHPKLTYKPGSGETCHLRLT